VKGKIIRAISGFFYVHSNDEVWTCKAKGTFRKLNLKPIVGDDVEFDSVDPGRLEGNLIKVLQRRNVLIRPEVANVDQAMIVFAVREPDPNMNLLDRFLIHMGLQNIPVIIYFNKSDLDTLGSGTGYKESYESAGYQVIVGTNRNEDTIAEIRSRLRNKTTVLAGPSGVGKSSLLRALDSTLNVQIGELSEKIKRGKQTTRHTELFTLEPNTYLLDTPGFTSLYVQGVKADRIRLFYQEFEPFEKECRFTGCSHVKEPKEYCGVKKAIAQQKVSELRYENYCQIYSEVKDNERRY